MYVVLSFFYTPKLFRKCSIFSTELFCIGNKTCTFLHEFHIRLYKEERVKGETQEATTLLAILQCYRRLTIETTS